MSKVITAEEARKNCKKFSKNFSSSAHREHKRLAMQKIVEASNDGKYRIELFGRGFSLKALEDLKNLGYYIDHSEIEDHLVISWDDRD